MVEAMEYMNTINNKLGDWTKIKNLFLVVRYNVTEDRKELLKEVYPKIRDYYYKYNDKFDINNPPTE